MARSLSGKKMNAREASLLYIGQRLEFNDGRIVTVKQNDALNHQIRMEFQDGAIGISRYQDLFFVTVLELITKPAGKN
jgi:hypothetical protein